MRENFRVIVEVLPPAKPGGECIELGFIISAEEMKIDGGYYQFFTDRKVVAYVRESSAIAVRALERENKPAKK